MADVQPDRREENIGLIQIEECANQYGLDRLGQPIQYIACRIDISHLALHPVKPMYGCPGGLRTFLRDAGPDPEGIWVGETPLRS
jgi:hypothetical protein